MDCRSKYKCRECHMRHHTLLHDPSYNPQAASVNVILTEQNDIESTPTVATTQLRGNVYLRILPVKVTTGSKTVTTLALLGDGSQTILCFTGLLKRLHAATKPSEINIVTIMGQSKKSKVQLQTYWLALLKETRPSWNVLKDTPCFTLRTLCLF